MKMGVAIVVVSVFVAGIGFGQQPNREEELELLRDEISTLTLQLRQIRREKGGLKGQLEQTVVALSLQEKRVSEAREAPVGTATWVVSLAWTGRGRRSCFLFRRGFTEYSICLRTISD